MSEAMVRLLIAIIVLIAAAIAAGIYFDFNAAILIFLIVGVGIYILTRIGGPPSPKGVHVSWVAGHGVHVRRRDYVQDDPDSGENQHEGDGFR
jgi:hypothetical protein